MKLLSTIVFLTIGLCGFSQSILAPQGAEWFYLWGQWTMNGPIHRGYKYQIGDTVTINGLVSTEIHEYYRNMTSVSDTETFPSQSSYYFANENEFYQKTYYAYADSNRLYFHDGDSFKLYCDFGLQVGDTLRQEYKNWDFYSLEGDQYLIDNIQNSELLITDSGIINVDGVDLRFIDVVDINSGSPLFWINSTTRFIERMISISDIWGIPGSLMDVSTLEGIFCYSDEDIGIYPPPTYTYCEIVSVNECSTTDLQFHITPNPAATRLNITFNSNKALSGKLTFVNAQGQRVRESSTITVSPQAPTTTTQDVSSLPRGMYVVSFETTEDIQTQKVVLN